MEFKKTFATNKEKEEKGVWANGPDGSRFLIARAGNPIFLKLSGQLLKPYRKLIQMGRADDKVINEISAEVTSRTVLLGWEGVKDDGKEVPYSQEEAKRRLLEYTDFADFISGLAQTAALFQDQEQEEAVKNS